MRFATALAALLLGACAALPPRGAAPGSNALADTDNSTLGRVAASSLASGLSGFRLLPTGEHAAGARAALAARSERSLDAQYYHVHSDSAGAAFLRELRDAAARGVRVRLLVDDYHAAATYPLLQGLAAYPGAEVRLFNPLPARHGTPLVRMLLSLPVFGRVNHRMHNKLFIADNQVAIFGGRNVADEYFMRHDAANFVDLDVVAVGPLVRSLSESFDLYWNSEFAYPLHSVLPRPSDPAAMRAWFDRKVRTAELGRLAQEPVDPLGQTAVPVQLAAGRLELHPGWGTVHADPPSKVGGPVIADTPTEAMKAKLDVIASAKEEVVIVSPYFVPGKVGMGMMAAAQRAGVKARVFTNSISSTDEPLAHVFYSRYREDMLRLAVELYEFSPILARRTGRFGSFGNSISRLHAKVAVVDRRWLLTGSVNLDGRSALFNTELSVVIDSPPLAASAALLVGTDGHNSMHRLRLAADGKTIEWLARNESGELIVTTDEPDTDWLSQTMLWLQSLFIGEEQI
jgi:putative cardiolipin synthase